MLPRDSFRQYSKAPPIQHPWSLGTRNQTGPKFFYLSDYVDEFTRSFPVENCRARSAAFKNKELTFTTDSDRKPSNAFINSMCLPRVLWKTFYIQRERNSGSYFTGYLTAGHGPSSLVFRSPVLREFQFPLFEISFSFSTARQFIEIAIVNSSHTRL